MQLLLIRRQYMPLSGYDKRANLFYDSFLQPQSLSVARQKQNHYLIREENDLTDGLMHPLIELH